MHRRIPLDDLPRAYVALLPAIQRIAHEIVVPRDSACRRFLLSSEYYLGTVPFQANPEASTLRVELVDASGNANGRVFKVDIKNRPFSTPEHVVTALLKEIQNTTELHEAWTSASRRRMPMPSIRFGYDRDDKNFWFSLSETQDFRLQMGRGDPTSILTKLGFPDHKTVTPGLRVYGKGWKIGDATEHGGRPIHDQRVRSDPRFVDLRKQFKKIFGTRAIKNPEDNEIERALHENLLLADYLFSLVFLSVCREKGPTMKVDINRQVDDKSIKEFNDKFGQVCKSDVGGTGPKNPDSLKQVMDFIKQVD